MYTDSVTAWCAPLPVEGSVFMEQGPQGRERLLEARVAARHQLSLLAAILAHDILCPHRSGTSAVTAGSDDTGDVTIAHEEV